MTLDEFKAGGDKMIPQFATTLDADNAKSPPKKKTPQQYAKTRVEAAMNVLNDAKKKLDEAKRHAKDEAEKSRHAEVRGRGRAEIAPRCRIQAGGLAIIPIGIWQSPRRIQGSRPGIPRSRRPRTQFSRIQRGLPTRHGCLRRPDAGLAPQGLARQGCRGPGDARKARTFSCFKVLLPTPINQTFWISDDEHHYPVKIEANGVLMPLVQIETLKAGEIRKYADAELALALPPDWNVYRHQDDRRLLTPNVNWDMLIKTTKLEKLSAAEKQSPRAWVEKGLPNAAKQLKNLQIRAASWQTSTISGRPAVSLVGDYVATGGQPMAQYSVCVFGKTWGLVLNADCPRDGVDDLQKGTPSRAGKP